MKKSVIYLLLFVFLVCIFGCQPTPSSTLITEKDSEDMLKKATSKGEGTSVDLLGIPDNNFYFYENTSSDGVSIRANAKIFLPDVEFLPIVRIKGRSFSEKDLSNAYDALFDNATPIGEGGQMPKSYYEEILIGLIEQKETGKLDKYASIEELDQEIKSIMEKMANAPEKATEEVVDLSFDGSGRAKILGVLGEGIQSDLTVSNMVGQYDRGDKLFYIRDTSCRTEFMWHISGGQGETVAYTLSKDANILSPSLSEEEALEIANQAIFEMGLPEFSCSGKRLAPLFEDPVVGNGASCQGIYEFMYTRQINGVPVTYTNDDASASPKDLTNVAPPWNYEKIRIFVDDIGIYACIWTGPCSIIDYQTDAAVLLPYKDIIKIFEEMISIKYNGYTQTGINGNVHVNIDRITLGLTRIIEKGDNETGLLVPAWDFFGWYDEGHEYPIGLDGYEPLMTINALDGSIIDRRIGY